MKNDGALGYRRCANARSGCIRLYPLTGSELTGPFARFVGLRPRVDYAVVKARARAFRWRKMLDTGVHATLEDLAAKGVHATYVSRVLRLTLLAPEIVEAILDGRQSAELHLDDLLALGALGWDAQIASRQIGAANEAAAGK